MGEDEREKIEAEEEEVEKKEVTGLPSWLQKIKANLIKVLSYTAAAAAIIIVSIFVTRIMIEKFMSGEKIREIGGKIVIPPAEPLQTFPLGEFTINIQGEDEEPHFIRVNIVLGYGEAGGKRMDTQTGSELGLRLSQIKHIINMILASKTLKDLESPEDKQNLSIEIRERINQIMSKGKIKEVYFESITVM